MANVPVNPLMRSTPLLTAGAPCRELLDLRRGGIGGKLREGVAQIGKRSPLNLVRLAERFCRQDEVAVAPKRQRQPKYERNDNPHLK